MALINSPPLNEKMILEDGRMSVAWTMWFMQVFRGTAFLGAGTTGNRPNLRDQKAGSYYLDTSLGANGRPIWVNKGATGWIDADGTAA